jgi:MFS superfamily sulfate permease-like transporter
VFSSILLVLIVLLVAPLAAYLPLATMAGILFLIAYGLIDVKRMKAIYHASRTEAAVMIVTLAAALFLGLQTAIYAGVLLSLLLFLNQAAHPASAMSSRCFAAAITTSTPTRDFPTARSSRCCASTARSSSAPSSTSRPRL